MNKFFSICASTLISVCAFSQTSGIVVSYIDKSVDPRDDFYKFANGTWFKTAKIPGNESAWGSFNEIIDRNNDNLKKILEECAADKALKPGSNRQKIADFYCSGMDTVKLEKEGYTPIKPLLAEVDKITTVPNLFKTMGQLDRRGNSSFF